MCLDESMDLCVVGCALECVVEEEMCVCLDGSINMRVARWEYGCLCGWEYGCLCVVRWEYGCFCG